MDTQQNPNEPSKPTSPGSKAANSKIAKVRSVNVSGASVKNKVAVNRAAVNARRTIRLVLLNQQSGGR